MMRFLCDEMLARLGRWLRAAGYDTVVAGHADDDLWLLEQAVNEDRILLTRDRELARRRGAGDYVRVLDSDGVPAQAQELTERLGVDWLRSPFTRCVVDNTPLRHATPTEEHSLPPRARALGGPRTICPNCGRPYWEGGHHRRMLDRLRSWQRAADRA